MQIIPSIDRQEPPEATLTCDMKWERVQCSNFIAKLPGTDRFRGTLVHPQHWPEDLDHAGKRVVVIGSGATAITLVPALARTAGHVVMLQRSPTYVTSLPGEDPIAALVRRVLPRRAASTVNRWY